MPPKKILLAGFTHATVKPFGTFARVKFRSTHPVVPLVVAGTAKPTKATPTGPDFASASQIVSSAFPLLSGPQTEHEVTLASLVPDTALSVVIKGKNHVNRVLAFRTRRRRLDVRFGAIEMIDDSDDLSPGEFRFGFYVDDENAPNGKKLLFPGTGEVALASGETKTIDVKATTIGRPTSVKVKVTGVENDDDPDVILTLDTHGTGFWPPTSPQLGSGSDSMYEWASAQQIIPVDFPGPEEDRTVPFTLDAKFPKKVDLHFRVTGSVKISHV
jgi:hypothetical protein